MERGRPTDHLPQHRALDLGSSEKSARRQTPRLRPLRLPGRGQTEGGEGGSQEATEDKSTNPAERVSGVGPGRYQRSETDGCSRWACWWTGRGLGGTGLV